MNQQLFGKAWHGEVTCAAAPAQVEGNADGVYFYFRNRYGAIWFGLGDTPDAAVEASEGVDDRIPGPIWLDLADYQHQLEAVAIIEKLLAPAAASLLVEEEGKP